MEHREYQRKVRRGAVQLSPVERHLPHLGDAIQRVVDKGVDFYVASHQVVQPSLNMNPYGHPLRWLDFTAVLARQWSTHEFLNMFNAMNGVAFNARGIPMPHWVMIDLALMPSAAVIATVPQALFLDMLESLADSEAHDHMLAVLERARHNDYDGPVPIGGYCAAPSAARGRWVGWSLWSVIPSVGLGLAAKSLALAAYQANQLDGVTQYNNAALRIHTQFGPLRVTAATVPLHSSTGSFVYENDFLLPGCREDAAPTFFLDPLDTVRQRSMQTAIEHGETDFFVLPPGRVGTGSDVSVPVLEVPRDPCTTTDSEGSAGAAEATTSSRSGPATPRHNRQK